MDDEWLLPHKWALRAHDRQMVFINRDGDQPERVVMRALLWGLYLPQYPDLGVELHIGDRYRPDVVALDALAAPVFWGEAGLVGVDALNKLFRRYRDTHFALAHWEDDETPLLTRVQKALRKVSRAAPIDVLTFPADSYTRFIDPAGLIVIVHDDLEWLRLD